MHFRFEKGCLLLGFNLRIVEDELDSENGNPVLRTNVHLYLTLPKIELDRKHIEWVKAAYFPVVKAPIFQQTEAEEEYDPLPF